MFRYVVAAALGLAVLSTAPAFAEETRMPRTIALTGHGEVRMAPDMASINVGVLSQAATAAEALAANTVSMNAIFAALKTAGIAEKDVQTSNFMVQPRYDYNNQNNQPPKLIGYDVSNNVTVTVRKFETLGAVLDQVVTSGSNVINGIQFSVAKPDTALDEARKLALADARHKAEIYAAAGKLRLGNILSLSEGGAFQPPAPIQAKMMRAEGMSSDVPIAGGEQVLSIDVNVVWEIE
ncbi:MAG: SIMPL domain-containing protein [Aestuariivirga sp.]